MSGDELTLDALIASLQATRAAHGGDALVRKFGLVLYRNGSPVHHAGYDYVECRERLGVYKDFGGLRLRTFPESKGL